MTAFCQSDYLGKVGICGLNCQKNGDKATLSITRCCDAFGQANGLALDCSDPYFGPGGAAAITCPQGYAELGDRYPVYITNVQRSVQYSWTSTAECEPFVKQMQQEPNNPAMSSNKIIFSARQTSYVSILLEREDFDSFSPEEIQSLVSALEKRISPTKSVQFEASQVETLRALHGIAHFWSKKSSSSTGVYTNSKCAGCSVFVEGVVKKGSSLVCDAIKDVVKATLCTLTGPFASFCNTVTDSVLKISDADKALGSLCELAVTKVANDSKLTVNANKLCSELTCTAPVQQSQVTGLCEPLDQKSYNQRCSEFLDVVDLAKKGICIAESIKIIVETAKDPIVAGVDVLQKLQELCQMFQLRSKILLKVAVTTTTKTTRPDNLNVFATERSVTAMLRLSSPVTVLNLAVKCTLCLQSRTHQKSEVKVFSSEEYA